MPKKSQLEEEMHFLGKKYPLKIVRASFDRVQIEEDTFVLYASKTDAVSLEKLTALFYNAELKKIVAKYLPVLQKQFEIKEPVRVCYKNVKSYFGECFPKKKRSFWPVVWPNTIFLIFYRCFIMNLPILNIRIIKKNFTIIWNRFFRITKRSNIAYGRFLIKTVFKKRLIFYLNFYIIKYV